MFYADISIQSTSEKGKGVFANEFIEEGRTIEMAPMLVLPEMDNELIDKSFLYNYYFLWGEENKQKAIALG
ncbi:MAG: hypothetical protein RL065_1614, partial [Bacteroidota bacterium]